MRGQACHGVLRRVLVPTALLAAGCASSGTSETVAEERGREAPRSLLEATTPRAAAVDEPGPDAADGGASAGSGTGSRGRVLVYSAITGHKPLGAAGPNDPPATYRSPAEQEAARARAIEAEIAEEMARQEQIAAVETARAASSAPAGAAAPAGADPLDAAPAPALEDLPDALFQSEEVTIPAGLWDNPRELRVRRRSLDVDEDGQPEEVRFEDPATGALLRSEQDLDYDGRLDAWTTWEQGEARMRMLDTNGDGRADSWERYADGRVDRRTLDRDGDGVRDTFYRYEGAELAETRTDANNDGAIDKVESYRGRHRVRVEEDRSLNGSIDTWITYQVLDGREVLSELQRDTKDRGEPDLFETYETRDGQTRLARREEDLNGDGKIDVVSIYEEGRLVQRAVSDEALSPL